MKRRMTAAAIVIGIGLSVSAPGGAALVATPCEMDAELCIDGSADASCDAVGLWTGSPRSVFAHAETSILDAGSFVRSYQNPHYVDVDVSTRQIQTFPPLPPRPKVDVSVHVGAIESMCHSYILDSTNGLPAGSRGTKSCGHAHLRDIEVTFETDDPPSKVRLIAEQMHVSSCASASPTPTGPITQFFVERVRLEPGFTIPVTSASGPIVPIGYPETFVAFNERFDDAAVPGNCALGSGTGMRIVSGGQQIILGAVSAQACQL